MYLPQIVIVKQHLGLGGFGKDNGWELSQQHVTPGTGYVSVTCVHMRRLTRPLGPIIHLSTIVCRAGQGLAEVFTWPGPCSCFCGLDDVICRNIMT